LTLKWAGIGASPPLYGPVAQPARHSSATLLGPCAPARHSQIRAPRHRCPRRQVHGTVGGGNRSRAGRCETPSRITPLPRNRPEPLDVDIPPRPFLSRPVPGCSAGSCDIRATWRGLSTSHRWVTPGCVARRSHGCPECLARSPAGFPCRKQLRYGASTPTAARPHPGRYPFASRDESRLDARHPSSERSAVASPGTVRESALAGTALL
jgi:hypothetical protein